MVKPTNLDPNAIKTTFSTSSVNIINVEQISVPSSSNGRVFTKNIMHDSFFKRMNSSSGLITCFLNQAKTLFASPSTNLDLDTSVPPTVIHSLGTLGILEKQGRVFRPLIRASQKEVNEASNNENNKSIVVLNNRDGRVEISGNKALRDSEAELAGKPLLIEQLDGSFIEIENVIFRELSESDQILVNKAVKIYLLYLQAIQDQERAKKKKESEEALIASATPNMPKHHDLQNGKIKEKFSVFPIIDYHQKPSTSKAQLLMQIQLEQLLAEREKEKENKVLEDKSSEKKSFLRKLSIVESSKKNQINEDQVESDFIKTSSLTVTVTQDPFSELLILTKSPNTVLKALPK